YATRLVPVQRLRLSLGHGTKAAPPGTQIAQQHEGGGFVVPALADVGTLRGLAHRMQVERTREPLELVIVVAHGGARLQPGGLGLRTPRRKVDLNEFYRAGHQLLDAYLYCTMFAPAAPT